MADHTELIGLVQARTGLTKLESERLLEDVFEAAMSHAVAHAQFQLPRGLGTIYTKMLQPTRRKLPNGEWVERTELQPALRYREGLSIRLALGKGDRYADRVREKIPLRSATDFLAGGG